MSERELLKIKIDHELYPATLAARRAVHAHRRDCVSCIEFDGSCDELALLENARVAAENALNAAERDLRYGRRPT